MLGLALGCGLGGCSVAGGALAIHRMRPPLDARSTDVGFRAQGLLQLPRGFRWTVGSEVQRDTQWLPTRVGHRWRMLAVGGYAVMPDNVGAPIAAACGYELLGRGGYARGVGLESERHAVVYGAAIALPCRPSSAREPWRTDGLVSSTFMIVPEVGIQHAIVLPADAATTRHDVEAFFGLSARWRVTSSIVP